MKLQEAINKFYRRCSATGLSENTIINYRYRFKTILRFFYAKDISCVEKITPDDVRAYLANMRNRGYAPDTTRDRFNGVSTFFSFLCEDGVLIQNPAKPVKKPKLPKIPARTFTTSELQKILGYYKGDTFTSLRNRLILYTLYGCGLRKAELLGLTIFSLHLDEGYMSIIGKGNKQRNVPITPLLEKMLRFKMKICPKCSLNYDDKYGFCQKCGQRLIEIEEQNRPAFQTPASNMPKETISNNDKSVNKQMMVVCVVKIVALFEFILFYLHDYYE